MSAYSLKELAERLHCKVGGNPETVVDRLATIQCAHSGAISFLANSKYQKYLQCTKASAVILNATAYENCPIDALICEDPYVVYAKVAKLLHPTPIPTPGVHPSSVVGANAAIAATASIGPNCTIGDRVSIGEHVVVGPNCVVASDSTLGDACHLVAQVAIGSDTQIGRRVLIHPGAVVGSDGFGIAMDQGAWVKIPQVGCVRLADDVEIGANTTIDRGAIEDTVLEQGVKLDNQIQIAHNVHIGAHTAIAGCSAIAGSTTIGRYCTIAGAVGIVGHLNIVDHVHITAMSLVTKSIKTPGSYSSGTPLLETKKWRKSAVRFKQLENITRRLLRRNLKLSEEDGDNH